MARSSEFVLKMKCSTVIDECEKQFGFKPGSLKYKDKVRATVQVRHIAIYLCRKLTGRSYPQIAYAIGYHGESGHTTAMYACRVAPSLLERNPDYAAKAKAVEEALTSGESNA